MASPDQPTGRRATPDAMVNKDDGLRYWNGINADVDGMLGGFASISRIDLQGSRSFLAKLGIGTKNDRRVVQRALEGGAGIGRITEGLLVGVAEQVDVIEPVSKFTDKLAGKPRIGSVYNMGLQEWAPTEGAAYGLVWIQWCAGHLSDDQLAQFLVRCKIALEPTGVIVVKENMASGTYDIFDEEDSSVTRQESKYRDIFVQAGLKVVKSELQRGLLETSKANLFPVRMFALKPAS